MVDLLGHVYVYGRVYVMSNTVPRYSTNQLLAYGHLVLNMSVLSTQ